MSLQDTAKNLMQELFNCSAAKRNGSIAFQVYGSKSVGTRLFSGQGESGF